MGTKKHIIKTALSLFISKSYKAVTMAELEKATGLTKGAFYHYFKNKEEIFIEVIDTYYLSVREFENEDLIREGTLKENLDFLIKQIEKKINAVREFTKKENFDPHFFLLLAEAREYYPDFKEKAAYKEQDVFSKWEQVIIRAKQNDEIKKDLETSILAENLIAIGTSIMKNILKEKPLDYSLSILKLQYDQFYRLIKN